jgi:hypothetical protein
MNRILDEVRRVREAHARALIEKTSFNLVYGILKDISQTNEVCALAIMPFFSSLDGAHHRLKPPT